jgi:hypothetical protein
LGARFAGWLDMQPLPAGGGPGAGDAKLEALRAELAPMKMSVLKKRALAAGVDGEAIENVDDADDPKEAVLTLLLELHGKDLEAAAADVSAEAEAELAVLRAELTPMKMSHLKKRALAAGVDVEVIEEVDDAEDPKEALVSILVEQHRKTLVAQGDASVNVAELEALRAELTPMKMSVLKKRALAAGVSEEVIEEVDDAGNPKEELVSVLVEAHRAALEASDTGAEAEVELEALRAELTPMKMSHLKKRALAAGVAEEVLDDVDDADDPKDELILVLVEERRKTLEAQGDGAAARAQLERLRAELAPMKVSALRKRALAVGVDTVDVEEAVDAHDPKAAIVALLLGAHASSDPAALAGLAERRPHFGTGAASGPPREEAARPNRQHAMLSYQWEMQAQVAIANDPMC